MSINELGLNYLYLADSNNCKNNCITLALARRSLNTTAVEYEENRLPKQAVLVNPNKFHTFLFQVSLCF